MLYINIQSLTFMSFTAQLYFWQVVKELYKHEFIRGSIIPVLYFQEHAVQI